MVAQFHPRLFKSLVLVRTVTVRCLTSVVIGSCLVAAAVAQSGPVIETTHGPVRGYTEGKVKIFKGVRYGAPTGGANRFKPPRRPTSWSEVREAKEFGNRCPQGSGSVIKEVQVSLGTEPQSEDCLFLNVWTPAINDESARPVMIWFHGGGYSRGSGSATWYDGTNLAARHDVVVISVNHRLDVFGFTHLAHLAPGFAGSGNAGMLDIVQALEWVRNNIRQFGGDASNVMIFGESGGAGKASTLMAMPAADGLFHRVAAESGTAIQHRSPEEARQDTKSLFEAAGIKDGDVEALQALPVKRLIKAGEKAGGSFGAGASPMVDGRTLPNHPFSPAAPAMSADVPLLIGSNMTESTFFENTPLDPISQAELLKRVKGFTNTDDAQAKKLIDVYRKAHPEADNTYIYQLISTDVWMRDSILRQAERKAAQGVAPVFVYRFEWLTPVRDGKLKSPHGAEIPFVFDNVDKAESMLGTGTNRQPLADKMSAAWVAFAKSGNPNADGLPHWPAYTLEERGVMVFDNELEVIRDPHPSRRKAVRDTLAQDSGM